MKQLFLASFTYIAILAVQGHLWMFALNWDKHLSIIRKITNFALTMVFVQDKNAIYANNAIYADRAICACFTMPFLHTMPIVPTMPFVHA